MHCFPPLDFTTNLIPRKAPQKQLSRAKAPAQHDGVWDTRHRRGIQAIWLALYRCATCEKVPPPSQWPPGTAETVSQTSQKYRARSLEKTWRGASKCHHTRESWRGTVQTHPRALEFIALFLVLSLSKDSLSSFFFMFYFLQLYWDIINKKKNAKIFNMCIVVTRHTHTHRGKSPAIELTSTSLTSCFCCYLFILFIIYLLVRTLKLYLLRNFGCIIRCNQHQSLHFTWDLQALFML